MKVFIVVLHFGSIDATNDCLHSFFKSRLSFENLIVVDNDGNFEVTDKRITVIKTKKNLGFAGGVNVGIKYALSKKADYVLLLNNDTIVKQNFLKALVEFSEHFENVGIVGPAIKFKRDDKFVYDIGGKLNKIFGRTTHKEVSKLANKKPRQVDYISGCAMLIKKEVFEKIGLFDEQFFLYYEDVDFCIRAKDKRFLTYVLPEVSVEHELSQSVGKVSSLAVYNQTKSALLFGRKYFKSTFFLNRVFIIAQSIYIFMKSPRVGISAFLAFKYL